MTAVTDIFLFDVDGTLTPPRCPMDSSLESIFMELGSARTVYLVSGSDISKIKEQMPAATREVCAGIFGSSGNELWRGDTLVYANNFEPNQPLIDSLEDALHNSPYPLRTGTHIERRPGMINYSIVGRNASPAQRVEYHKWDQKNHERKRLAISLMSRHPEVEVSIGGEISIDIYPLGNDKSQAVRYIQEEHPHSRICFFGDKTEPPGNDYSAVVALGQADRVYRVGSWHHTYGILKSYLEDNCNE